MSGVTLPEKMREIWSVVLQIYKTEQAGGLDVNQCPDIVTRLDREICAALTVASPYTPTDLLALIYTGIAARQPSAILVKEILEKLSFAPQSQFAVIEHSLIEIIGEVRRRNVLYSILAESENIEQLRLSVGNDYAAAFATYLTGLSNQDVSTVCTALVQVKCNINQYKYADNYESQEIPRSKLDVWKELFYKPYLRTPVSVWPRTAKQIMSKYLSQLHIPNEQVWHNKLVPFGSLLKQMAENVDQGKGPLGLLDFLGVQMFRWVKGPLAELRLFRDRNSETTFYNLLNKKQMFTAKQRQGLWFTISGNLFAPTILLTLGLDMALFYFLPKMGLVALFSNACALAIFAVVGLFYLTFGMGMLQKGAYIREVGICAQF